MDKMTLNREVRYYPRFKRDFYELVVPNLSNREAAFTFCQCLCKEVDHILGSGDYDVEQMFKRLDEKHGDPSKMTDSIICEIQRFKRIENDDNKRVIEYINLIERNFHNLKSIRMEREINNANVVSMIELKLPKSLALNWYRFIHPSDSKVDKSNKFPYLLYFLVTERSALEYGLADLRISLDKRYATINYVSDYSELKCLIHESHKTTECRSCLELSVKGRYEILKDKYVCFSCLSPPPYDE